MKDWSSSSFSNQYTPATGQLWPSHLRSESTNRLRENKNKKKTFKNCLFTNIFFRSSPLEVFLRKFVLKICSKFTGEHPCRSAISIKLLCNFIEITLRHGCSPIYLLHIFRTPLDGCFYFFYHHSKNFREFRRAWSKILGQRH